MWRKLGKIFLILTSVIGTGTILFGLWSVAKGVQERREIARRDAEDDAAYAYAARLRADGDRLAAAGEWEDALARYEQSQRYDRRSDDEQNKKLQVIKEHVGEVVWDKEFEAAHRSSP